MSIEENFLLNITFFDNRMKELDLKRWWVAEEIGVDRKTVSRWLTGQTKKIRKDNLAKLATILECPESSLILLNTLDCFATANEQKEAAKLIEQEDLLKIITPTGKWDLFEGLIKASMEPNLPKSLLAQLYNYLCIAAWRKSDLRKAEGYLQKALDLTKDTNHKSILLNTHLNKANIHSFKGEIELAIKEYEYCIENAIYFEDKAAIAPAQSNLACTYHEYGDLQKSLSLQKEAIQNFEGRPLNLSIAYIGLADVLLELGDLKSAQDAVNQSLKYCQESKHERGFADCDIFNSLINSKLRNFELAYEQALDAEEKFRSLKIEEGRTHRTKATALYGLNKNEEALKDIEIGLAVDKDFPFEMYKLLEIKYQILKDRRIKSKYISILKKLGASKRLSDIDL